MSLLLTSVFKPFGVDDAYGRKENKLELFDNQVTREQGIFSLRYNHRSFGLYFMAENIRMPAVVLDFPSLRRFRKELEKGYDFVGISFITPNFVKARKMAEMVREVSPRTKIILGGHGTCIPEIEQRIECDHVIRGEGIRGLRELFGEDPDAPITHPAMPAADHQRILGLPFPQTAAVLVPGVGCPNACRFCCTSHFFDKTYHPFFETGQQLFEIMIELSETLKVNDFFVMDENFLKHKDRAMELLELMERHNRAFNLSIFSSAETVREFGIENMVRLGITYLWIGVESKQSLFDKTQGIDVKEMIAELRRNGIFVLASSILFLEHHDKQTIWEDIDFAVELRPDFTQFMQLGPLPPTALYDDYKSKGLMREDIPFEEWHGQHRIWFDHEHFTGEESADYLRRAFHKEFLDLGPSILRVGETMINGLDSAAYKNSTPLMRKRHDNQLRRCKAYRFSLTALRLLVPTQRMADQAREIEARFRARLGPLTPLHLAANCALYLVVSLARFKLNLGFKAHNPGTMKTCYRLEPSAYKQMQGRIQALWRSRKTWAILERPEPAGAGAALSLHFSGAIKNRTVNKLVRKLRTRVGSTIDAVNINITPLASFRDETLELLLLALSRYSRDIRVYCTQAHRERIELLKGRLADRLSLVATY